MTDYEIIGLILLVPVWALMYFANKQHIDETGVDAPTRSQLRGIRQRAHKKGISEEAAYSAWLERKQKKAMKDLFK